VGHGDTNTAIVGLPDAAVKESRERVSGADELQLQRAWAAARHTRR
jgi:predicted ATPase with chaperone activity